MKITAPNPAELGASDEDENSESADSEGAV